jgi:glycosyltransferase involved in cell wall biosynthesis
MAVAYFVSRFPKVTETFILREIVELQRLGADVELFSLVHEREGVTHEEALPLSRRAHYGDQRPGATLLANIAWLVREPRRSGRVWRRVVSAHWRQPSNLARAVLTTLVATSWASILERSRVDHVHAHWATWPTLAAWTVRELTGLPYTFTAHAHDLYVDRTMLSSKIEAAERVVTISEFNRSLLEREYDAGAKTVVVRCGVDLDQYEFSTVRDTGVPFTIACVAALEDYKGHEHLLRACSIARARGVELRCVLVGEGPRREAVERLCEELALTATVQILGRRSRDQVRSIVRESDAFVLASVVTRAGKTEGIPVALMEAMALGRPVVATDVSGVRELVTDRVSGRLVAAGDAEALADAIVELAGAPLLRQQLAREGRRRVETDYDLRRNVAVLNRLLASPSATCTAQLA